MAHYDHDDELDQEIWYYRFFLSRLLYVYTDMCVFAHDPFFLYMQNEQNVYIYISLDKSKTRKRRYRDKGEMENNIIPPTEQKMCPSYVSWNE